MFVNAREVESFEEVYRRFKRGIETAGSLREYRRKQRFKPAHEERRDKIRAAQGKRRRAGEKAGVTRSTERGRHGRPRGADVNAGGIRRA
jgi:ribosomal protein S21